MSLRALCDQAVADVGCQGCAITCRVWFRNPSIAGLSTLASGLVHLQTEWARRMGGLRCLPHQARCTVKMKYRVALRGPPVPHRLVLVRRVVVRPVLRGAARALPVLEQLLPPVRRPPRVPRLIRLRSSHAPLGGSPEGASMPTNSPLWPCQPSRCCNTCGHSAGGSACCRELSCYGWQWSRPRGWLSQGWRAEQKAAARGRPDSLRPASAPTHHPLCTRPGPTQPRQCQFARPLKRASRLWESAVHEGCCWLGDSTLCARAASLGDTEGCMGSSCSGHHGRIRLTCILSACVNEVPAARAGRPTLVSLLGGAVPLVCGWKGLLGMGSAACSQAANHVSCAAQAANSTVTQRC